ncbi:MAG: hypothetical protein ACLTBV_11560 [Enterocloster bolteae]
MAVNPSGTYLYLTTEMGCTCIVYKKSGLTWKPVQEISTVPKDTFMQQVLRRKPAGLRSGWKLFICV